MKVLEYGSRVIGQAIEFIDKYPSTSINQAVFAIVCKQFPEPCKELLYSSDGRCPLNDVEVKIEDLKKDENDKYILPVGFKEFFLYISKRTEHDEDGYWTRYEYADVDEPEYSENNEIIMDGTSSIPSSTMCLGYVNQWQPQIPIYTDENGRWEIKKSVLEDFGMFSDVWNNDDKWRAWFRGKHFIDVVIENIYYDFSNEKSLRGMFTDYKPKQDIFDLRTLKTTHVTNMREMFKSMSKVRTLILGESWSMENVIEYTDMFKNTKIHVIDMTECHSKEVETIKRIIGEQVDVIKRLPKIKIEETDEFVKYLKYDTETTSWNEETNIKIQETIEDA